MTTTDIAENIDALAPADRFFVREIPLDAAAPAASQVELALEETSPFPLAQMYHGFVTSPDGQRALAYAAYRRRFTDEEQAGWADASAVVPAFVALLGAPPTVPTIALHVHPAGITGVAWDGKAKLPVAVVSRALADPGDVQVNAFVAELRRTAGLPDAEARRYDGHAEVGRDDDGNLVLLIGGTETGRLPAAAIADADVRDKSFLADRRREATEGRRWWFALLGAVALLLLALGLEIGAGALGVVTSRRRGQVDARADEVRRIETAQTLAVRIDDLVARQQRPFEWLAQAAAVRPKSISFIRAVGQADRSLEIEAQTPNAADVGAYENALRKLPGVAEVQLRDLRAREGMTTFVAVLRFQAQAAAKEANR